MMVSVFFIDDRLIFMPRSTDNLYLENRMTIYDIRAKE